MNAFRAAFLGVIGVIGMGAIGSPVLTAQSLGDPFEEAYERLRRGPDHLADAPTGRMELTRTNRDGLLHRYVVIVPENYDASRRYPVAFYLHGGVSRPDPGPGGG
jgi:dipeptidyl aminopeptidase/acylaminoacyl peptidase